MITVPFFKIMIAAQRLRISRFSANRAIRYLWELNSSRHAASDRARLILGLLNQFRVVLVTIPSRVMAVVAKRALLVFSV